MRRTLCRLAAQYHASVDLPPLISIANGTFYRQHPSSQPVSKENGTEESSPEVEANPPLFPGLDFTIPSFSEPKQHWSILSKHAAVRTTFLQILRGQHICLPPTARSYPYLGTDDIAKKDPRLRSPSHAIQYVGFDAERGTAGGSGMRGAYMSARYESRKEETDFSLRDYLFGNTELNADETLARHPDQALVDQIMVDLKLEALESMPVTNLSNGQTRRARIAKALLAKPELLLLDGPFMGLDPPTVKLLANILQRLAEAHSPRLILSLKPDEEYPAWITHTAYLNSNFTVDSLGPRKDITQNIIQRAKTLWRGTSMNDMTREEVDLIAVSNHLRGNEPYPESLGTVADHALYMRTRGQQERATGKLLKSTVSIHSRDGFTADPTPVPPPGESLIEMKGVNVKYNDKSVLGNWKQEVDGELKDGLWWNVCRGQRWGVFGPNGDYCAHYNWDHQLKYEQVRERPPSSP
jgi:ABC-type molybdenum transport system ATPase subunit/photorepair protein PhrA